MKKLLSIVAIVSCLMVNTAFADATTEKLAAKLKQVIPETPKSITKTPIPGLYEANYGMQIYYVSEDGKYLFDGDMINMLTRESITAAAVTTARADIMAAVPASKTINFPAKGDTKHVITVFTDIDCGYCRKLHNDMDGYNELGIEVRYMMFPRAGLKSQSFNKAVSAWCADDQQTQLTQAKNLRPIPPKQCSNPIAEQYALGQQVGVRGTPAIVTSDGQLMPGYRNPTAMLAALEKAAADK